MCIRDSTTLVIVTAPGPGSGKMAVCLSQLYNENKRGAVSYTHLVDRRSESVVNDERHPILVSNTCKLLDVEYSAARVADGFAENNLGVPLHR